MDANDSRGPLDLDDETGDERDRTAAGRDQKAQAHDEASDERDERADARDERAEARERAGGGLVDAAAAAADRAGALRDREGGASDRTQAADDRHAASVDRALSAQERVASGIDELTGAQRRDAGTLGLERDMARATRTKQRFVVAFIDVDHLKVTNDLFGHAAGDRLLRQTADAIRAHLRPYDLVVRFGGDEFVCGLLDATMVTVAERFSRVSADLAAHQASVTVGLAELQAGDALTDLIARADQALYEPAASSVLAALDRGEPHDPRAVCVSERLADRVGSDEAANAWRRPRGVGRPHPTSRARS